MFDTIAPIENADTLIDIAFRRAKERTAKAAILSKSPLMRQREKERIRMAVTHDVIHSKLRDIGERFPKSKDLTPFYKELMAVTLDMDMYKKSLGSINWASQQVNRLWRSDNNRLTHTNDPEKMRGFRKAFYGRTNSVLKQVLPFLKYLEQARKILRGFPAIKEMPTVAIVGFPNVGKTTLLYHLSGSKPEIASYAFTTRGLNIAYIEVCNAKLQLVDTPGTLNRVEGMNNIEKQAYLAQKMLSNILVFVFDPTESYPIKDQIQLYNNSLAFNKPVIIFVSKTDLVEVPKEFKVLNPISSLDELRVALEKEVQRLSFSTSV